MDMKISGSGQIAAGEYENVRISGSGRMSGLIRCQSFHTSGSSHGDEIEVQNDFRVSGSSRFDKNVKAGSLSASGSFSCSGDVTVTEKMSCSGSAKIGGSLKCGSLSSSGSTKVVGDTEADIVNINGTLNCGGLLNAEEITIRFDNGMEIGSIGGSKITIHNDTERNKMARLPLLSKLIKAVDGIVYIKNSIEGDEINVKNVTAPRISGRIVTIGDGCKVDLLQYSEQIDISPNAQVGEIEKL